LVSYWTLSSVGWHAEPFAERTAVMIIASAAPNLLAVIVVGLGIGMGLFAGPNDWWLTFLPAAIATLVAVGAIWAAGRGHRLAARTKRRWLREGLHVVATGVSGTVEVLRRCNWRVLGTWVDLLGWIGALWAALYAVGEHLPFAVVAMSYLIGQIAQVSGPGRDRRDRRRRHRRARPVAPMPPGGGRRADRARDRPAHSDPRRRHRTRSAATRDPQAALASQAQPQGSRRRSRTPLGQRHRPPTNRGEGASPTARFPSGLLATLTFDASSTRPTLMPVGAPRSL